MQHIPDEEMWVDIAKEINTDTGTHPCAPLHANNSERPMTLLWRMCCLRHKANQFRMKMQKPGNVETYYHWANCRDTGNLTIEPGRRHPLRKLGIVYSQFSSPMKEIFELPNVFPLTILVWRVSRLTPCFAMHGEMRLGPLDGMSRV